MHVYTHVHKILGAKLQKKIHIYKYMDYKMDFFFILIGIASVY